MFLGCFFAESPMQRKAVLSRDCFGCFLRILVVELLHIAGKHGTLS